MKKIPQALYLIFILTIISICSGAILAFVWNLSVSKMLLNQKKQLEATLFQLNPQAKSYEIKTQNGQEIYFCYDQDKNLISKFFLTSGNGFQGNIKIAVSVSPDFKIINGIQILEQAETPGLGARITESNFLKQFTDLALDPNKPLSCVKKKKDNTEIEAITGATISSKAVVDIIRARLNQ